MRLGMLLLSSVLFSPALLAASPSPRCVMSLDEKAWADGALAASDYIMEQRLHLPVAPHPAIVLFNDRCRFEAAPGVHSRWVGTPHQGKIDLFGSSINAGVTSFASDDEKTGRK